MILCPLVPQCPADKLHRPCSKVSHTAFRRIAVINALMGIDHPAPVVFDHGPGSAGHVLLSSLRRRSVSQEILRHSHIVDEIGHIKLIFVCRIDHKAAHLRIVMGAVIIIFEKSFLCTIICHEPACHFKLCGKHIASFIRKIIPIIRV